MDGGQGPQSTGRLADARWADPDHISACFEFKPGKIWLGRHPHDSDIALGHLDDKHVLICAGNRSGKGRSLIINNMAVWPGSLASYDPKGDLATMLAPRRGQGNAFCDGMGQDVFVLDPKRVAEVDEAYRAYFNPLEALNPDDDDFLVWCDRIADVIVKKTEGTESASWAEKAKHFLSMLIAHVRTGEFFKSEERNLLTVYRLCQEGHHDYARALEAETGKRHDPFTMLLEEIEHNETAAGELRSMARSFRTDKEDQPKLFNSVRNEAALQLAFLKSQAIKRVIAPPADGTEGRSLDLSRMKTDPRGISVFVVLPTEDSEEYSRWANTVFLCMFAAARQVRAKPASGHQTLCVLDEFLDLGKNDYVRSALRNIAGAGVKLMIVVQGLGELEAAYDKAADAFFTNCGLKLFFGDTGREGPPYIEKALGETQIVLVARNATQSKSHQTSTTTTYAYSETEGTGETRTEGTNWTKGKTRTDGSQWSESLGWNTGVNWSDSTNWGRSEGDSAGRNYGPHIFFRGLEHTSNYGTSFNRSSGGGKTKGGQSGESGASVRGGQSSVAQTESVGGQTSTAFSSQQSQTRQWSDATGIVEGYSISGGVAEQFFKKPLLAASEVGLYLKSFSEDEKDHPAYPGLMLVMADGERPFFVRRSNYDQDPYFIRCFSPDPAQDFIPIDKQPMLGFEFTPYNIVTIEIPPSVTEFMANLNDGIDVPLRRGTSFREGDTLFSRTFDKKRIHSKAPVYGRVLEIKPKSDIVLIAKMGKKFSPADWKALSNRYFSFEVAASKALADEVAARRRAEAEAAELIRKREAEEAQEDRLKMYDRYQVLMLGAAGVLGAIIHSLILLSTAFIEDLGYDSWHNGVDWAYPLEISIKTIVVCCFVSVGLTGLGILTHKSDPMRPEWGTFAAQVELAKGALMSWVELAKAELRTVPWWTLPSAFGLWVIAVEAVQLVRLGLYHFFEIR